MTAHDTVALSSLTERVGDAERDVLVSELNGHHAHGRLTSDELDRRLGLALTAVTRYDLLVLVADLPASDRPVRASRPARRTPDAARLARRRELRRTAMRTSTRATFLAAPLVGAGVFLGQQHELGFWGTMVGGAIGWTTHAARGWLDDRADRRPDPR